MRTVRARHATARGWWRCAGRGPCMRVPWGKGSGGVGLGARGSCQGGGDAAPRPCPGFPPHLEGAPRGVAGGCFGNGFIAGLAQFSYKSKESFCREETTPPDACRAASDHRCGLCHQRSSWRPRRHGDPCCSGCGERLRVPWGEGSGGVGLGARGSCQGGGVPSGPFDRLRANGFGERGAAGLREWGRRRRAAPLDTGFRQ